MALAHSRLTAQGQISVPAEVRRKLAIGPGSILEWQEDGDQVIVRRAGRFSSEDVHAAIFTAKPRAKTLRELKTAIRERTKAKHARR